MHPEMSFMTYLKHPLSHVIILNTTAQVKGEEGKENLESFL